MVKEKQSDLWRTPKEIYKMLNKKYKFNFDPCPYPKKKFDGLSVKWKKRNFVNPPYSQTELWVRKALEEYKKGHKSVMLLRLDASTKWFRDLLLPNAEIMLFDDRLHFISSEGKSSRSNFASILALVGYGETRLNIPVIKWR